MRIKGDVIEILNLIDSYSNLDGCRSELKEALIECYGIEDSGNPPCYEPEKGVVGSL